MGSRRGYARERRRDVEPPHGRERRPPEPQPEHGEPRLADPGATELSKRDYVAILKRASKESLADQITDLSAALAYRVFLAIPSVMLVAIGGFSVFAGPEAIRRILDRLAAVAPSEALDLLEESMTRVVQNQSGGLVMIAVGGAVALWATTSAMTSVMRALNVAYDRKETRGFVRQRLTALAMLFFALLAFVLAFGLLVLGPHLSRWVGSAVGLEGMFGWIWWTAQWPVLIGGLLLAFAVILYLGPNVDHPRWHFITFGAVVAVAVWVVASGLFAVYTSQFGSYNKAWGSLAAVIVLLTWLWLSGLALLFGAEINAEAERSRELRRGEPAAELLQAPPKS